MIQTIKQRWKLWRRKTQAKQLLNVAEIYNSDAEFHRTQKRFHESAERAYVLLAIAARKASKKLW